MRPIPCLFICRCLLTLSLLLSAGCIGKKELSVCHPKTILSSEETAELQQYSSELRITVSELQYWDEVVRYLLKKFPLERDGDSYRLYAYLYHSQKVFADNSFMITGAYSGNLDYVSLGVIRMFYPDFQTEIIKDTFSEKLSNTILPTILKRHEEEESQIRPIPLQERDNHWKAESPHGLHYETMKPWSLQAVDEFKSPAPPDQNDSYWEEQLKITKEKARTATPEQKQKSLFWQRELDPEAADWRFIAAAYMNKASIPLQMQLVVREKMMMALVDALIAVFHDKYSYLVKRPFMRDPNVKTLFTTPNHPSYPAAHGTFAGAAETVLSYYFPENQREWKRLAEDARQSRLWGGIHFPIDLDVGEEQGIKVGNAVIFR
jgi:hypothetical protein